MGWGYWNSAVTSAQHTSFRLFFVHSFTFFRALLPMVAVFPFEKKHPDFLQESFDPWESKLVAR
jgi:hypothetical protein